METKITSNIYLAAAYLANGAKVLDLDRSNPRHVRFRMRGSGLSDLEVGWTNGTLVGNLTNFAEAIRQVKALLYDR